MCSGHIFSSMILDIVITVPVLVYLKGGTTLQTIPACVCQLTLLGSFAGICIITATPKQVC